VGRSGSGLSVVALVGGQVTDQEDVVPSRPEAELA
jgi:hypothetical protein